MHNKSFLVFIMVFAVLLTLPACMNQGEPSSETVGGGFRWNEADSHLVDYTVVDGDVRLRYLLSFENSTESDVLVKYPGAKFSFFDLQGWMEYESVFSGTCENGETSFVVESGEKKEIILVFKGVYTGGTVKEDIKVSSLVMMQDFLAKEE